MLDSSSHELEVIHKIIAHQWRLVADLEPISFQLTINAQDHSVTNLSSHYQSNTNPVTLLLGDAGMGKTVVLKQFLKDLLQARLKGDPIPIYMHCARLTSTFADLIESFFQSIGVHSEEVEKLRKNISFIFLFDAYDTAPKNPLLCINRDDKLLSWSIKKIIISSRSICFYQQPDFHERFKYIRKKEIIDCEVLTINPLKQKNILDILSKNQLEDTTFNKLIETPGLLSLISNVSMLSLCLSLIKESISIEAIYEHLINRWIKQQITQLSKEYPAKLPSNLQQYALSYLLAVARRLYEFTDVEITNKAPLTARRIGNIKAGWTRFFRNDEMTRLTRYCCPFQCSTPMNIGLFGKDSIKSLSQQPMPRFEELPPFLNGCEGHEIIVQKLKWYLEITNELFISQFIAKYDFSPSNIKDLLRLCEYAQRDEKLKISGMNIFAILLFAGIPLANLMLVKMVISVGTIYVRDDFMSGINALWQSAHLLLNQKLIQSDSECFVKLLELIIKIGIKKRKGFELIQAKLDDLNFENLTDLQRAIVDLNQGIVAAELGKSEAAVEYFQRAIHSKLLPLNNRLSAYANLVSSYHDMKKPISEVEAVTQQALAYIQKIEDSESLMHVRHYIKGNLAESYIENQLYDEALALRQENITELESRKTEHIDRALSWNYYGIATAYIKKQDLAQAQEFHHKFVSEMNKVFKNLHGWPEPYIDCKDKQAALIQDLVMQHFKRANAKII